MKTLYFSFARALLFTVLFTVQCQAACWCYLAYCVGITDPLLIDESQTETWEYTATLSTAEQSNGSCPVARSVAPEKVCDVSGVTVHEYQGRFPVRFIFPTLMFPRRRVNRYLEPSGVTARRRFAVGVHVAILSRMRNSDARVK